jgi:CRP-like cAMP-binding protein
LLPPEALETPKPKVSISIYEQMIEILKSNILGRRDPDNTLIRRLFGAVGS